MGQRATAESDAFFFLQLQAFIAMINHELINDEKEIDRQVSSRSGGNKYCSSVAKHPRAQFDFRNSIVSLYLYSFSRGIPTSVLELWYMKRACISTNSEYVTLQKIFLTSKFQLVANFLSNPTYKTETGTASRWGDYY